MSAGSCFDEFVAARSPHLLWASYLLTRDHGLAEDLLQNALAKAWFAWRRIDGDPEPYVRKVLVNTYASWWRWAAGLALGQEAGVRTGRLPPGHPRPTLRKTPNRHCVAR